MGGEITLQDALEQVDSANVTTRGKGLADLKHVLRSNRRYESLSNDSFHRIYETLFGVAVNEQSAFLKAKTTTVRSAAEKRLSLCASTLRLAVESGVRYLRLKTVRSVFDHIIQTLRLSSGTFCEPLALDYAKCLKSLISYQAHAEHLTKDDRERIATFCVECIQIAVSELADDDAAPGAELLSTTGTVNGLSYRSSRSNFKDSGDSQGSRSLAKQIAEEMATCVSVLTVTPNAAPGSKGSDLLSALIGVLQDSTIGGSSHQDAFAAINHVLAWIRTEDIQLTREKTSALVRLIRNYWSGKSSDDKALLALRDELLTCWVYIRPYILSATHHQGDPTLRSELRGVLDVMRNEYSKRDERRQLHIDDLRLHFSDTTAQSKGLATTIFSLQSGKVRAESCWTTVYMLATLCDALGADMSDATPSEDEDDEDRPRKRPRLTSEFDETLASSVNGSDGARTCALQTLAFLAQQRALGPKYFKKAVEKLCVSCADDNATVSSWAMLALASFASQASSTAPSLSSRWSSVWQIAVRAMSNASTCRAACHLMLTLLKVRLVPQQTVSELVQTMTSAVDLNGPSMLADSVAHLLVSVVKTSQQTNPTSSAATAESVLSWTFRNFWPSKFADRTYASQHAMIEPRDVVELVSCCLGQSNRSIVNPPLPTWGPVGQVWLECSKQQDLIRYLLLLPDPSSFTHEELRPDQQISTMLFQLRVNCEALVLNHIITEMYRAQEQWSQLLHERPRSISLDLFASFCKSCLVATCIAFSNSFRDSRRQLQLQKQTRDILETLANVMPSGNCPQEKVDVILTIFSSACTGLSLNEFRAETPMCEQLICHTITKGMSARRDHLELNGVEDDEDEMDIEGGFESQDSRRGNQDVATYDLKNEYAAQFSIMALRAKITTYAAVVTAQNQSDIAEADSPQAPSTQIVDYLLALPESSMLLSVHVMSALPHLGVEVDINDCYRLLDYCAEKILSSYSYERSEVALGAILDLMSSLAPALTNAGNLSLYGLGIDMYNWYASVALRGGVLSPRVQERVASLLLQLCHVDTDYGRDDENDVPSVRTSLFKLVELGTVTGQYYLANRISTIFGLFILSNHPAMFDDLQASLPADTDWIEGMAMRLLFLSRLASAWPSLLRQCVYYIFETAGRVQNSIEYATRSIRVLAESLKFSTPQKFFSLFAPQLLHTWLESQEVTKLPFAIFEYDSLRMLIEQNQNEITAQLLVRGDEKGMEFVVETLETTKEELVKRCFAKCQAYCIGWDIPTPPQSSEITCESRLRKLVGNKDEYKTLVSGQFAVIMGYFYLSLQQEDIQDKWLEKRPNYNLASKALAEMKAFSHSERVLPPSQQPCFKSKYLCDQIERLRRRTGDDPSKLWEASTFAVAVRMLLDSIEDALGPLHACLTIRRLRLLICMAGEVAVSGFPLEILIHTLHTFLADSQCADDVMGVLQYLFHHGQQYLQANLRFLYGTVILMILKMRKHSVARLESTTQESQHKATVQRMREFQAWLVNFLQKCHGSANSRESHAYASIADALRNVSLPGNARKKSPESALLLLLLDETGLQKQLISDPDRKEAVALLSDDFELPANPTEDCLEDDTDCVRFQHALWRVIRIPGLSETFTEWTASALGRAYASTGLRPRMPADEERKGLIMASTQYNGVERSQATIARRLSDLAFSRNRDEASLADYTLRNVLVSFKDEKDAITFEQMLPPALVPAMNAGTHGYDPFFASRSSSNLATIPSLQQLLEPSSDTTLGRWAQSVSLALCRRASDTAIFPALTVALQHSHDLALELLPCMIHILLVKELEQKPILRVELSKAAAAHLSSDSAVLHDKQQYLIELLLYLREQALPGEHTHAERLNWLEIDWLVASEAADRCGMPTAALMFAESASTQTLAHGSRRSSARASFSQVSVAQVSQELLLSIFKSVEEPDSFYGVEQQASLDSVLGRLDYEADGYRSLMFRSAKTDTQLRRGHGLVQTDSAGVIHSISMLNLNSVNFALLSGGFTPVGSNDELLNTARRLQQWDILLPDEVSTVASSSFAAFQELSRASERPEMQRKLRSILMSHVYPMTSRDRLIRPSHEWFGALAFLAEMSETINCIGLDAIRSSLSRMHKRESWMSLGRYEDFNTIVSNRHTIFSVLAQNRSLSKSMGVAARDCRLIEVESLLSASRLARQHGHLQEALAAADQCSDLVRENKEGFVRAMVATKVETASVLWDLEEITASVNMLRDANTVSDLDKQDIPVGRSGLLAQLAHQLAEARLERPDDILLKYLKPAIAQLQGHHRGEEAGRVFHEFATFCYKQLRNPGNVEELERITKLRDRKRNDVDVLDQLSKQAKRSGTGKDYSKDLSKAKQWYQIDDSDYRRLKRNRDTNIEQSLQNYLRALYASDEHDISILRFFALWLEHSDIDVANATVSKYLPRVPSWKFVVLMNQLMSRLEQDTTSFQTALKSLAARICSEHPHHSLHHLFASTREPSSGDQAALSRYHVAIDIQNKLRNDPKKRELLDNVFKANNHYRELAAEKTDGIRQGSKISAKDLPLALMLIKAVPALRVPPATIDLPPRSDGNYDNVPYVARISSTLQIMAGNSRPKKVTTTASNGEHFVLLLKTGEDLRQDAIMEQVFGEVSKMLQNHKSTRQRHLHVRTYKVVPLSTEDGIIEFVQNSISFQAFLVPAHERYYPHDIKNNEARDRVSNAARLSIEPRIKEFEKICEQLHPVLRHFFFERFKDPDEWFEKRTAYTRTTATISILGHVLGLGDRHCQNIMLDEKTGEVVHIDLGIAFEAGRVLPVPELVPFRLSRDVVDGMGITKTEGVFRRCCEFTMDALREDKDSIMTLLNVLRYDPLYTWTVSPLRAKRMQDESGRRNAGDTEVAEGSSKKREEAGEADRALSVVENKLSKTLSTAARVNELIQQATDVRNLATLFSGWSAYF